MIRASYHITKHQLQQLRAYKKLTGLSVAEIIRRAIDAFMKQEGF